MTRQTFRQQVRLNAVRRSSRSWRTSRLVAWSELAQYAGLGRAARWVGRSLSQLPEGSTLPWHRVIAAGGRISLPADSPSGREQRLRLRDEGVLLHNDRVDMTRYGWRPMEHSG